MAPPSPRTQFQSLPAILRTTNLNSMPRYSKAPRGLFVLVRVNGIFTTNSISPGPPLRQRSTCYSFRAGRNLPDKELRYHRTVIVTAAVHSSFISRLDVISPIHLTYEHWAGVSPYTSACAFAETCVFVKQSVEPLRCDLPMLCYSLTSASHPSPEVTDAFCRVP